MQQLVAVWSRLDVRRRVIAALATLAMFTSVLAISRMATAPQMSLLYSGLESGAAGEVLRALEEQGAAYDIRGGAIYVDSRQRDALRMTLAADGLPANGTAGYEVLDSLSGFGTTSQMFDAAYWRAKEGELARTIMASPFVRAARVHIANASGQPFRRDLKVTASVTVTPANGTFVPDQARALRYLVASSVAGLSPDDVSVIDGTNGTMLLSDGALPVSRIAGDHAATLRQNVERLLAARMGPGRTVVEVSVETETDSESIIERRFDPDGRVAISTDTEERNTSANDRAGAGVTVASNLPDGEAAPDKNSNSSNSETRERVNYEVSETQRELRRTPGAIKRLSVAVILDGIRTTGPDGIEEWAPLPAEELEALEQLVASAVGFDAARGDVITLKSMPLEQPEALGTTAAPGLFGNIRLDLMSLVQLAVLAIVGLVLGLFVVRPVLSGRGAAPVAGLPAPERPASLPYAQGRAGDTAEDQSLTGEIVAESLPELTANSVSRGLSELPREAGAQAAPASADPVDRLRRLIEDRREDTVEVLRHWIEHEEEST
ncbi:MAG: flagellar M-ring protein FliF [Confluentimicrobium sp.]|uniref:flagellar basal-body MS-ring/collar protein FliF n=1 Tax=Actibacterium sp. TaxID=1872125 RepID=UPI000C5197B2|nr:flagellar basal-body MS-ring/collar protein FliF [Actibacterium sp.]MBC56948.1 flagellar M-ring protein FliF [Actibacterium sp.]